MSQGPETRFIKSVHRLLPLDLYFMKNHNSYVGGPADVWYSGLKGDSWVEYKYVRQLPALIYLMDTKKKYALSALQQKWLRERHLEGRKVFVVLGCFEGGVIYEKRGWEVEHRRDTVRVVSRFDIAEWISMMTKGHYEVPPKRGKRIERCV